LPRFLAEVTLVASLSKRIQSLQPWHILALICLGAFALRLFTLQFVQHPGIGDPNHYYNLALRLLDGHGFTIDYIWQYYNPPQSIVHPEDFWMPLTGILTAVSMGVFGISVQAAVLPFLILGSMLPIVGYSAARQFGCLPMTSLFAAAAIAVLPEFVLNSMRTDTTLLNTPLICLSILWLTRGLQCGGLLPFVGAGIAGGLAYLTRGDNLLLLPMLIVTLLVYALWGRTATTGRRLALAVLVPIIALVIITPWLLRNVEVSGTALTPNLDRLFFLTDFREHYAYGRDFNLETLLASQTPAQLIGKRLFEMAASIKMLYIALDLFLPVAVAGGALLLVTSRDRQRWLTIAPTVILLGGVYVFYTVLMPIANQGGSFKKSYLSLIPLLLPLAAYALERAIVNRRMLIGVIVIAIGLMGANGVELVRAEARFVATYLDYMTLTTNAARALPDTNGDGQIILMAQDPFMLRYFGIQSVAIPMESREVVLEVAQRYGTDYLMMPPARPSLDPLYDGTESDPRFVEVVDIPQISVKLFAFNAEAAQP
jgi:4-amino-4-deoxy-L-arabinose transferase-like glycosyltransferase